MRIGKLWMGMLPLLLAACSELSDVGDAAIEATEALSVASALQVGHLHCGVPILTLSKQEIQQLSSNIHLSSKKGMLSESWVENKDEAYYLRGIIEDPSEIVDFGWKLSVDHRNGVDYLVYEEGNQIHSCNSNMRMGYSSLQFDNVGKAFCDRDRGGLEVQYNLTPVAQGEWPWMVQ